MRIPIAIRVEVLVWSLLSRALVRYCSLEKALKLLDNLPTRTPGLLSTFGIPPEQVFGRAGACLGRSLARSQFLRMRGRPHAIVIGGTGGTTGFVAHAWIEPCDPPDPRFVEIRRISR